VDFEIRGPQPGPQTDFLSKKQDDGSVIDWAICGGEFFGGKTISLVMDAARNIDHPHYHGCLFRRTYKQLTDAGGMCDACSILYPQFGGVPTDKRLKWSFPSGASILLHHLQHDSDIYNYRSSQFCFLGIDQIEEFPMEAMFYLGARTRPGPHYNRVVYRRATCNPEPGWLANFLQYYWSEDTGYHHPDRSGHVKYFTREKDRVIWVDKSWRGEDGRKPLSFTYVYMPRSTNVAGMQANPDYSAVIGTMDEVSQERLGKGNWKVIESGGMFRKEWFKIVKKAPDGIRLLRYWDFAASEVKDGKDPDFTARVKMGIYGGDIYIVHSGKSREEPGTTIKVMERISKEDGRDVAVRWEEEKGSAGKFNTSHLTALLIGYDAQGDAVSGSKVERARPLSSAASNGRLYLVEGDWNADFITAACMFPKKKNGIKIDEIDAASGGLKCLTMNKRVWEFFSVSKTVKLNVDWSKTSTNILHYAAIVKTKENSCYWICALWDKSEGKLYIYHSGYVESFISDMIAVNLSNTMNLRKTTCTRIVANELFFGKDARNTALLLNKSFGSIGVTRRVQEPLMYDPDGAINYITALFLNDLIVVNSDCTVAAAQFAGWEYDESGTKVKPGFPCCEALCLISTELKKDLQAEAKRERIKDYGTDME
jgi:predicted phage terminase large subunit-like protein